MTRVRPLLGSLAFTVYCYQVCAERVSSGEDPLTYGAWDGGTITHDWDFVIEGVLKQRRALEGGPDEKPEGLENVDTYGLVDEKKGWDDHKHDTDSLPLPSVKAIPETGEDTELSKTKGASPKRKGLTCAAQSPGRRVVSMADQHGDFKHMLVHLQKLGLVGKEVTNNKSTWTDMWSGGDTIFIQTGDVLDRGPDGKLMYHFLWRLQDHAAKADPPGKVVLLLGNHELLVLQGDVRYVTNVDFCQYAGKKCAPKVHKFCQQGPCCTSYSKHSCRDCMPGNCEFLQTWDKNGYMGREIRQRLLQGKMKIAHKQNGVVYVHAGLLRVFYQPFISTRGVDPIEAMNQYAANLIGNLSMKQLSRGKLPLLETSYWGSGPMWTRVCMWPGRIQCMYVEDALKHLDARAMVIGHCPQRGAYGGYSPGISRLCGGKFLLADTFMSIAYCNTEKAAVHNMAALEFYTGDTHNNLWSLYAGRKKTCST